jgi:hypothetical protein
MATSSGAGALKNGGYIAGPIYDWCCFILAPLFALGLGYLITNYGGFDHFLVGQDASGAFKRVAVPALFSMAFTHAHLVIVFFRSHVNQRIFRLYPWRFTVVPIALLIASLASQWVFVVIAVLTVWWDVYHSSLQTFGLGRIYDQRHGNDINLGRRADYWFNLVIYAGPVLAGVNLWAHLKSWKKFERVEARSLSGFADVLFARRLELRWIVVAVGALFVVGYLVHYYRLARRGYRVPVPKLALYLTTAFVSVACWGFGSFGEAFLIMNFFHAFQYFAIVWWSEKKTIAELFHAPAQLAFLILIVSGLGYGFWRMTRIEEIVPIIALGNVVSLMHFWYDGFVWSVRKGQV